MNLQLLFLNFMKIKNILFAFFALFFCLNLQAQESESKKYFDLKSFVGEQVKLLEKAKPSVEKNTIHNSETESKTTNKIDWEKELRLFANADINEAILKDAYKITKSTELIDYQALSQKLKVQNIHIEKENGEVKKLFILYKEENNLFEIEKKLTLNLIKNHVANYQIEITQKIIFKEQDHYQVSGKIIF